MRGAVPSLLREGMSETDLCVRLLDIKYDRGFHGSTRFQSFQGGPGEWADRVRHHSLYPTNFDGPGGHAGLSAAAPIMGSRERKLRRGDTVFVDTGFGIRGYNTDKSQAVYLREKPTDEMVPRAAALRPRSSGASRRCSSRARARQTCTGRRRGSSTKSSCKIHGFGDRRVRFSRATASGCTWTSRPSSPRGVRRTGRGEHALCRGTEERQRGRRPRLASRTPMSSKRAAQVPHRRRHATSLK